MQIYKILSKLVKLFRRLTKRTLWYKIFVHDDINIKRINSRTFSNYNRFQWLLLRCTGERKRKRERHWILRSGALVQTTKSYFVRFVINWVQTHQTQNGFDPTSSRTVEFYVTKSFWSWIIEKYSCAAYAESSRRYAVQIEIRVKKKIENCKEFE